MRSVIPRSRRDSSRSACARTLSPAVYHGEVVQPSTICLSIGRACRRPDHPGRSATDRRVQRSARFELRAPASISSRKSENVPTAGSMRESRLPAAAWRRCDGSGGRPRRCVFWYPRWPGTRREILGYIDRHDLRLPRSWHRHPPAVATCKVGSRNRPEGEVSSARPRGGGAPDLLSGRDTGTSLHREARPSWFGPTHACNRTATPMPPRHGTGSPTRTW
jgi:hypothetical protein